MCKQDLSLADLIRGTSVLFSTVLATTERIRQMGFFDESLAPSEDWELMMRLATARCQMRGLPLQLTHGRVHPQNTVRRPAVVAASGLEALEKVFSLPGFPEELLTQHQIARGFHRARMAALGSHKTRWTSIEVMVYVTR